MNDKINAVSECPLPDGPGVVLDFLSRDLNARYLGPWAYQEVEKLIHRRHFGSAVRA
ncbi:hypothetical protein [Spongiactinospora gelatinilytica]|uniref:hypothetical protein n=1 Tax=Spongiactinospora gelatinilytica TaxID=2666298 RepID=UPI00131477F8|nr:hypothetical protein [Spongiactinospora gelatinilytica]